MRCGLRITVPAVVALGLASDGAAAQGFADLGTGATGYLEPERGRALLFPADHGAHPGFRVEWWYLTANLRGADGADYGVQWTLFRSALAPGEAEADAIWMGHAAVTSASAHLVAERLGRGGTGQAGVRLAPFEAWIDDWQMAAAEPAPRTGDALSLLALRASGEEFTYELMLEASGPLVAQGEAGYSVKSSAGQASHYYSQPFYQVSGVLTLPGGKIAVTGQGWLDREWSSQPLAGDQTGWDWLSLHFDSGEKLMGFRLRDAAQGYASATWIGADGTPELLPPDALRLTPMAVEPVAGRQVPVRWRVELAQKALDISTAPLNPQAWMATLVPYWEGPIRFDGSHRGRGYLEMTGYE